MKYYDFQNLSRRLTFAVLLIAGLAAGIAQAAEVGIPLRSVNVNLSDRGGLQRGAATFVNYCLSCHSASYMRYERMANDLGISDEVLLNNLMFATDRKGSLMTTNMPAAESKEWFGKTPPNLSLIARVKSPDYLYTYLTGFYPDDATVTGWNNVAFPNAAMPHVMYAEQGLQVPVSHSGGGGAGEAGAHGDEVIQFELVQAGNMTPAEFDNRMTDLVNFLVYLAEPAKLKRYGIGIWVTLFLLVLLGLTYLLKKEYWKDVH